MRYRSLTEELFLRDIWIENANEILQLFVQERRVVQSWV